MTAPETLGPFTIVELLGEGGSAFVYAARDPNGREIALKVLRPELELEPREVQRFVEEAGKMRRVSHAALVPVLDVGMLPDGRPFIAMPRLVGRTLAERITAGPLPVRRAVSMFEDVAHAVVVLHDAGLVHRDIKPENILWLDSEDRLVVLDLGIARETDSLASTTTRAGKTRGTPAYMAPERFFGSPATVRTDVYELGVLLYVMLTGAMPWEAEDPRGRMSPKLPAEYGVLVPGPLVSVLMRALDVDFERRPDSATELLAEVQAAALVSAATGHLGLGDAARTTRQAIVVTPPSPAAVIPNSADPAFAQAPTQVSPALAFPIANPTLASAGRAGETPPHVATLAPLPPAQPRGGATLLIAGAAIAIVAAVGGALGVGALRGNRADAPPPTDHAAPQSPSPTPEPSATASEIPPAPTSEASVTEPAPSSAPSSLPRPIPSAAAPSATSGSPPAPSGSMPVACAGYIAIMCDPKSGSTAAECAAARTNVPRWIAISPAVAIETCGAALNQSRTGLALRRSSPPPPPAPTPAPGTAGPP